MIRLDRTGISPPARWGAKVALALPEIFVHEARLFEELPINARERRSGFRHHSPAALPLVAGKRDFKPLWRTESYVKLEIGAMSGRHCSYCQSAVGADQHGDVEHFKPRSLFPTLAYEWANYFLSCQLCNYYKRDKWPTAGAYVRPDENDPQSRLVFAEDGSVSATPGDFEAERTILDFGLDRDGLKHFRSLAIERALRKVKMVFVATGLSQEERKLLFLDHLTPDLFPYSAAINQNLLRLWTSTFPDDPI